MPTPITPLITTAGAAAAVAANGASLQLLITHVVLGASGYTPAASATALVDRREKAVVSGGGGIAAQLSVVATFSTYGGAEYDMKEIGFYAGDPDAGGVLFAVASVPTGRFAVRNGSIAYTAQYSLTLSGVPSGSVTVTIDAEGGVSSALMDAHVAASNPHSQYVRKIGDTMTGPLVLPGNASSALQAVPKQQLDALVAYGTFTPELRFGGATTGITYATRDGRYTKIGRLLIIQVYLVLTNKGSATGVATIDFGALAHLMDGTYLGVVSADNMTGLTGVPSAILVDNTKEAELRVSGATGSPTDLTHSAFTNTTLVHLAAHVFTDL